jgi:excisionase family DNA binding protein
MEEYTIKEAAQILDVSTSTIRRRIKSGELKAKKKDSPYGKQYFIPENEFEQAIAKNEIMEIKNVDKPVAPEVITNRIIRALESHNRDMEVLFEDKIKELKQQQKGIVEEVLNDRVEEIKKHNEAIVKEEAQNIAAEINSRIDEKFKKFEENRKNDGILHKIKKFFIGD